jgi:integrase
MSENTVRIALRTAGYDADTMTAHGFRAMARTILDEVLGYPADWIEHQLAHAVRDANGRAYNRTKYLEQRAAMLQAWADYLDHLRDLAATGAPITRSSGRQFAHGAAS